jgi:hypothetical protein
MSDHQAGVSEKDDTSSPSQQNNSSSHEPENALATISGNILDRSDTLIYAIVGACFFLGASSRSVTASGISVAHSHKSRPLLPQRTLRKIYKSQSHSNQLLRAQLSSSSLICCSY